VGQRCCCERWDVGPRIAIVDDHALVRGGLSAMLRDALDAQVVFQGAAPEAVLALDPPPDIVLLDLMLGDSYADPQVASQLQRAGCKVLVVSALADPEQIRLMIDAGVAGFINKSEPPEVLVKAIRYVLADGTWTSPEVAALVAAGTPRPELSPGQLRVLMMYASGMPLDSVARQMGISTGTAATHLKRARQKYAELGRPAGSRVDLYRQAVADGIVPR
jgi:two-component system, NarL family, uhpT operon response regulator UhpA